MPPKPHKVKIEYIVDEMNPFSKFGEEDRKEAMTKRARGFVKLVGGSGRSLDVGVGTGHVVANEFKNAGFKANTIDILEREERPGSAVKLVNRFGFPGRVRKYHGDIENINGEESELKNNPFDVIYFWGSWSRGLGMFENWTIDHESLFLTHEELDELTEDQVKERISEKKRDVLEACRDALAPGGKISIVSSRHALHGGGYGLEDSPMEIAEYDTVIEQFKQLGAKKITLIGRSIEHLKSIIDKRVSDKKQDMKKYFSDVAHYEDITELEDLYDKVSQGEDVGSDLEFDNSMHEMVWGIERARILKLGKLKKSLKGKKLGLIDAIIAEF